jgi:YgiT-type zinc finger domain-containing protein
VVEKEVEKLLRGGKNTAVVRLRAEVCLHCGERLYSKEAVGQFERIRAKLTCQDLDEFQPMGQSFQVAI